MSQLNPIDLKNAAWQQHPSHESGPQVEIAILEDGHVAIRAGGAASDPSDVLIFTPKEWDAFVRGAIDGEFNPSASA